MKSVLCNLLVACSFFSGQLALADQCAVVSENQGTLIYNQDGAAGSIYGKTDSDDRLLHGCFEWAKKGQNTDSPTICFNAKSDEGDLVVTSITQVESHCSGF